MEYKGKIKSGRSDLSRSSVEAITNEVLSKIRDPLEEDREEFERLVGDLEFYVHSVDQSVVRQVTDTIACIAMNEPEIINECMDISTLMYRLGHLQHWYHPDRLDDQCIYNSAQRAMYHITGFMLPENTASSRSSIHEPDIMP